MTETTDTSPATPAHLWESDHDYYCQEGNFYKIGCHTEYRTWGDFIAEMGDADLDMNLLFRWDWRKPEQGVMGELQTFWVGQRKATLWSMCVSVHPDEEEAVRAFLQPRFEHLMRLWAPLAMTAPAIPTEA